jgi:hypothetical protein
MTGSREQDIEAICDPPVDRRAYTVLLTPEGGIEIYGLPGPTIVKAIRLPNPRPGGQPLVIAVTSKVITAGDVVHLEPRNVYE